MNESGESLKKIYHAVLNFDLRGAKEATKEALEKGIDPLLILNEGSIKALREAGSKFEKGEYFLPEIMVCAEAFQESYRILEPELTRKSERADSLGRIVIGTVVGDMHDIGKNLVKALLSGVGFEVYDLGRDVPIQKFVEKAKEVDADIVAMSALLTVTMQFMGTIIAALRKAGSKAKTIVGGAPVTADFAKNIGADAFAGDALLGVEECKRLVGK
ncbi:MAG: cobalamin B12-binding domain-containing protein [Candidatus Hadarchaeum sp.]|uniref:cobalamin B12-binding domain-containing protein n=1 Tax=Candidatus Hadarchaeum sp. TaxID=2883567 RepID=UPI003D0B3DA4